MTAHGAPDGDASLPPGAELGGRYIVVRKLGEGGFGAVYEAVHGVIEKRVALKVLTGNHAHDPAFVERFRQEARTAVAVRHLHIVEVLDFGEDQGRCYLVMEYLEGETLQQRLDREGHLAPETVVKLLLPIAKALGHAHAAGVIHRDVKPENIFLARVPGAEEAVPKLLDFGIARPPAAALVVHLTDPRTTLGTPAYMAPEQAAGIHPLTAAVDQWALASVFYELLSGRLPHDDGAQGSFLVRRAMDAPTPLSVLAPTLDAGLVSAVMRAMARDPAARFASMEAFREALHGSSAVAYSPTLVDAKRSVDDAADTLRTPAPTQASVPPPRRPRWWLVAMVAAMAVTLGAIEWSLTETPANLRDARGALQRPTLRPSLARTVTFRFTFEPAMARIRLDDVDVGLGRASVTRPRDGARHTLVVSAPGYITLRRELLATGDCDLDVSLDPDPSAPQRPRPRAR